MNNQREESFTAYLNKIANNKSLSTEEEYKLAAQIRQGSKKARDKLIAANLRFVVSVAFNYVNQGVPLADLVSEGNLGLIKAAKLFHEDKQCRFNSYAVWWIRQKILLLIANQSRFARIPVHSVPLLQKICKLQKNSNMLLSNEQIAQALNANIEMVNALVRANKSVVSLDAAINLRDNSSDLVLNDVISDNKTVDDINKKAQYETVKKILMNLDERSRAIIMFYFGIKTDELDVNNVRLTLQEIGDRFNISRERVRQIRDISMRKLRKIVKYINYNIKPLKKELEYGKEECTAD